MNKSLLTMLALAASTSAFAQAPITKQVMGTKLTEVKAPLAVTSQFNAAVAPSFKAPSTPDYVRYYVPTGTFFVGWDTELSGYSIMLPIVSPFTEFTFTNSTMPADSRANTQWQLYGSNVSASNVDADYNYVSMVNSTNPTSLSQAQSIYYVPTLVCGTDSFNVAMFNESYINDENLKGITYMQAYNDLAPLSPFNNGSVALQFQNDVQLYGNTTMSYDYQDGEGTVTMYMQGLSQRCPKPMTPLYATDLHIAAAAYGATNGKIIDKALTMYIMNAKDTTITATKSDGTDTTYTTKVQGDQILYTLTADPSDQVMYNDGQAVGTGNLLGSIVFYNKQQSSTGATLNAPFVLDQDYYLVIPTGLQSQTNKINLAASVNGLDADYNPNSKYDDGNSNTRCLLSKSKTGLVDESRGLTYTYYRLHFAFNGIMDVARVETDANVNKQYCGAEGGQCATADEVQFGDVTEKLPALVQTAMSWYGEDEDNYTVQFTDDADWVTAEVSEDARDASGYTQITFTCDPLPAGVTGRATRAYVEGTHGVNSADYIYIIQGDASEVDAINGVVISDKTANDNVLYNLAGQRVGKDYKGVVVKNGQKFINK